MEDLLACILITELGLVLQDNKQKTIRNVLTTANNVHFRKDYFHRSSLVMITLKILFKPNRIES